MIILLLIINYIDNTDNNIINWIFFILNTLLWNYFLSFNFNIALLCENTWIDFLFTDRSFQYVFVETWGVPHIILLYSSLLLKKFYKIEFFQIISLIIGAVWAVSALSWGSWWTNDSIEILIFYIILNSLLVIHCKSLKIIRYYYFLTLILVLGNRLNLLNSIHFFYNTNIHKFFFVPLVFNSWKFTIICFSGYFIKNLKFLNNLLYLIIIKKSFIFLLFKINFFLFFHIMFFFLKLFTTIKLYYIFNLIFFFF